MKLTVFLRTSGCGKTKEIIKRYLHYDDGSVAPSEDITIDGMKVCHMDVGGYEALLLGHYHIEHRCKGCDTLSMSIINDLIDFIRLRLINADYDEIVVDGDRINNEKFWRFLDSERERHDIKIVWINAHPNTVKQWRKGGNPTFIMTTYTKTNNSIARLKESGFNIEKIQKDKSTLMGWL